MVPRMVPGTTDPQPSFWLLSLSCALTRQLVVSCNSRGNENCLVLWGKTHRNPHRRLPLTQLGVALPSTPTGVVPGAQRGREWRGRWGEGVRTRSRITQQGILPRVPHSRESAHVENRKERALRSPAGCKHASTRKQAENVVCDMENEVTPPLWHIAAELIAAASCLGSRSLRRRRFLFY